MAGQHVQPPKELSKLDGLLLSTSLTVANGTEELPFGIAPFDLVIERAELRFTAIDDTANQTAKVVRYANGSSSPTDVTGTVSLTAGPNTNKQMTLATSKGVPSENIVRVGELITLKLFGGTGAITGLVSTITCVRAVL